LAPGEDGDAGGSSPAEGWYPDPEHPEGSGRLRYWSGNAWTVWRHPADPNAVGQVPAERPERLGPKAQTLYWAVAATWAASMVGLASSLDQASALRTALDGDRVSDARVDRVEVLETIVGLISGAAGLAMVVFFLIWFNRAYKNIPHLRGGPTRFTSGWSVGAWFIPILNLIRPKQIADEIWRSGDPEARRADASSLEIPAFVHWWWGTYVAGAIIVATGSMIATFAYIDEPGYDLNSTFSERVRSGAHDPLQSELTGTLIAAGGGLLSLVALALLALFIRGATERQDAALATAE
jgi:hypothetical protein